MITYEDKTIIIVKLDGKRVGEIRKGADDLYRYFPKGKKEGGAPFVYLENCKASIEG